MEKWDIKKLLNGRLWSLFDLGQEIIDGVKVFPFEIPISLVEGCYRRFGIRRY